MTRRIVIAALLTALIFSVLTLFWFPYMATDIPTRYGVPLVFHETGCFMPRPHATAECVHTWHVGWLLIDLVTVAAPSYAVAWLFTRKKTFPEQPVG